MQDAQRCRPTGCCRQTHPLTQCVRFCRKRRAASLARGPACPARTPPHDAATQPALCRLGAKGQAAALHRTRLCARQAAPMLARASTDARPHGSLTSKHTRGSRCAPAAARAQLRRRSVHDADEVVDVVLAVAVLPALDVVQALLGHAAARRAQLERPQEVGRLRGRV